MNKCNDTIFHPAGDTPCRESLPVNPPSVVVVNCDGERLSPEALQKISESAGVPVENVIEVTNQTYREVVGCVPPTPAQSASVDALILRGCTRVPELKYSKMNRDDRPWYDKFNRKKRKK